MKKILTALLSLLIVGNLPLLGQAIEDFIPLNMRNGMPESRVRNIGQSADGRIVIVTAGTITLYDETRFTVFHLRPEYEHALTDYHGKRHILCDSTGLVWLRNDKALFVLDTRREELVRNIDSLLTARRLTAQQVSHWSTDSKWKKSKEYALLSTLASEEIYALFHDSYGGLWVGLKDSGILYYNPLRRQQFHTTSAMYAYDCLYPFCSPRASKLSSRYAPSATNCTLDASDMSYTFLGTRSGVMIINRNDSLVATISECDGLSTNNIVALLKDCNNDVWAATADGLTRIHQMGADSFSIVSYGLLDGIDTNGREFGTCQIHSDSVGRITVGFAGGSCWFHPDSVKAPRHTFYIPRQHTADNGRKSEGHTTRTIAWLLSAMAVLLLTILYILRRKETATTSGQAVNSTLVDEIAQRTMAEGAKSADEQFLELLQENIRQHLADEEFSVQTLSELMAMDRSVLYRRMQAVTNTSPSVYIKKIRMNVAKQLLTDTEMPVSDIALRTGFSSTKYFSASFKEVYGVTPNEFRNSLEKMRGKQ